MPKSIITKNMNQRVIIAARTGHGNKDNYNLIKNTSMATADVIITKINNLKEKDSLNNCYNNCIETSDSTFKQKELIKSIDIISPNFYCEINNEICNSFTEIVNKNCSKNTGACDLEENKVQELWTDYINPYLEIGPYKIPPFKTFNDFINLINEKLNNLSSEECPRLHIYKGILDILIRGRSMYFYDLELETTVTNLRNKICELNNLVLKYSSELALCNGEHSGMALAGSMGIRLNKPKNLIYAQALLNINLAWYIYLYNTKKIEYDKYQGVIQYISEKGKTAAYDELIALLDEKFKDIEDDIADAICDDKSSHDDSSSSNDNTNNDDSKSSSENSSEHSSCDFSDYEDNYCNINLKGRALVLGGSLTISMPSKFSGNSGPGTDYLDYKNINIPNKKKTKKKKKKCENTCEPEPIGEPAPDDLHWFCYPNKRALMLPGSLEVILHNKYGKGKLGCDHLNRPTKKKRKRRKKNTSCKSNSSNSSYKSNSSKSSCECD